MAIQKIPNTLIADNAVTAAKIANGTLTADDIAANSITGAKISATTSLNLSSLEIGSIQTTTNFPLIVKSGTNNHAIAIEEASGGETWQLGVDVDGDLGFYNSGGTTASVTFDDSGSVGIGTNSPSAVLETFGGTSFVGAKFKGYSNGKTALVGGDLNTVWFGDDDGSIGLTNSFKIRGASNTATIVTNSETRVTVDGSGNVGIGTTSDIATSSSSSSTGFWFSSSDYLAVARNQQRAAIFNRIGNDGEVVAIRKDGSTVGSISSNGGSASYNSNSGVIFLGNDQTNHFKFLTSQATGQPRFEPSGDNTIDVGRAALRFKDLYLSGGVHLGGTGSANKLDDYEEGTWTPSLQRTSGGQISAVYSTSPTGSYTKIGRLVHITIIAGITSVSSQGSGYAYLTGLPFVFSGNSYEQYLPMTTNTFGSTVMTAFYPSSTAGYFGTGISSTGFPPLQVSWTAGTLRISGVYKTT